jgi:hypothetical protein
MSHPGAGINYCVFSFSQQPPQQKNDDFCAACLTGICLCCALESRWLRGSHPHHVLKRLDSTLRLPLLTCGSVSLPSKISAFVNDDMTSFMERFCCDTSGTLYLYKVGYETSSFHYAYCWVFEKCFAS